MANSQTSRPAARPRPLAILSVVNISKYMKRFVLTGEELEDFPVGFEGGYVKLFFHKDGDRQGLAIRDESELSDGVRPVMRSMTVREATPRDRKLTLDVALHPLLEGGIEGPAAVWAHSASVGDTILVGGPGPVKLTSSKADWVFIAGDMTALPAISCNLAQLSAGAQGHCLIEVLSQEDIQAIDKPAGIELHWIVSSEPPATSDEAAEASEFFKRLTSIAWPESGTAAVWVACEFNKMRAIRRYVRSQTAFDKSLAYMSSYWKAGRTDEEHKQDKKLDTEK